MSLLLHRVRFFFLSNIFNLLIRDTIWSYTSRNLFESIFLDNDNHPTSAQKEEAILRSSPHLLVPLYHIYFFLTRRRDTMIHIDVPKFITMHLHKAVGLLDPTLSIDLDDRIHASYAPLHYHMSQTSLQENWEDVPGCTIHIFRFAHAYPTVADFSLNAFAGFTRPFHIHSDAEFSRLYYDVLQQKPCAGAGAAACEKIREGKVNAIAVSYRHFKDDRHKLGISKRDLISALRTLHAEALPAGPVESYCIWWDSVLKCRPAAREPAGTWAAVGLTAYAFCHVLSIRRDSDGEQNRFWIDIERALASLRSGLTAVRVADGVAEAVGVVPERENYPEEALADGLRYVISGDLHDSEVSFEQDRDMLRNVGLHIAVRSKGLGVVRALQTHHDRTVLEAESWDTMENSLFLTVLNVRLGIGDVFFGTCEPFVDGFRALLQPAEIGDRRNWLPNSDIYRIRVWNERRLPMHMERQRVAMLRASAADGRTIEFGLQLFYQEDDRFHHEAVHGCVTRGSFADGQWRTRDVARIFVPTESELLEDFKILECLLKDNAGKTVSVPANSENIDGSSQALQWLCEEVDVGSEFQYLTVVVLPNGKTTLTNSSDVKPEFLQHHT